MRQTASDILPATAEWHSPQSQRNFQKNCQALEARAPELVQQLRTEDISAKEISAQRSKDGHWVLFYQNKALYSRYRPIEECKRWIEHDLHKETNAAIFAGFGLGYQVDTLLSKRSKALILVVESSYALFKAALCLRDLSELLSKPHFFCSVGPAANLEMYLHRFSERSFQFYQLQPLFQLQKEFYQPLQTRILNLLKRFRINSNTLSRFGQLWVKNIAMNTNAIARAKDAGQFYGLFGEVPFLLVAAGPSLEQLLDAMPQLRKRFVILAVDTALGLLLQKGIQPDFVVSVDPQALNARHFDHCSAPNSILISESCIYPSIFQKRWRAQAVFHSSFPLMERIERHLGGFQGAEHFAKVHSGGSVATAAWDFARSCKAKSLYAVGLDLSYPSLRSHCPGSLSQRQSLNQGHRLQPVEHMNWRVTISAGAQQVASWKQSEQKSEQQNKLQNKQKETVLSDKRMGVYRNWLEERIKKNALWPNYVIDGSDGRAARIEGMHLVSLQEALQEPERRSEIKKITASILHEQPQNAPQDTSQDASQAHLEAQQRQNLEQILQQILTEIRNVYRWSAELLQLLCSNAPQEQQARQQAKQREKQQERQQNKLQAKISQSTSHSIVSFFFSKSLAQMAGRSPEQEQNDQEQRDQLSIYQNFYLSSKFHLYWLELALLQLQSEKPSD